MPAPAITTILRFLYRTLRSLSRSGFSPSDTSPRRRSRRSVVRSFGSANFRLLRGRELSSLAGGVEAIWSGAGVVLADERCEDEGEG